MTKAIFYSVLALLLMSLNAKAQSISVSTVGTISTCNSNSFSVDLNWSTSLVNASLVIDFPDAAVFQNTNGYQIIQSNPGEVEITGINLIANTTLTISYDLYFPCDMISPTQDAVGNYIPFELNTDEWHIKNSIGVILASESGFDYFVNYPLFVGSNTNDPSLNATSHQGQTITRFIEFSNQGTQNFSGVIRFTDQLSCTDVASILTITLDIVDANGSVINTLISATPTAVPSTSPSQYFLEYDFGLNSTNLPISTSNNIVSLRITETIQIDGCLTTCGANQTTTLISSFDLDWGCHFGNYTPPSSFPTTTLPESTNLCQSIDIYQASISRDAVQPYVLAHRITPTGVNPTETLCFVKPQNIGNASSSMYADREYKFVNYGASNAHAVNLTLTEAQNNFYPGSQDLVFLSDIQLLDNFGNDITAISLVPSTIEYAININPSQCVQEAILAGKTPIMNVGFTVSLLLPNQEVTLKYKVLRCCPETDDYFNSNIYFDAWNLTAFQNYGIYGSGFFSNECTLLPYATELIWGQDNPVNGLYDNLYPKPYEIQMVQEDISPLGDMLGGSNSTCNYNGTRNMEFMTTFFNNSANDAGIEQLFANSPNGNVNGQLKVVITLDQGLLLNSFGPDNDPGQINLVSANFTLFPVSNITSSYTSYGAPSSSVELIFDLSYFSSYLDLREFMENAKLKFPLTPCCPSYMDDPASYQVDWYLNLSPNYGSCPDCWMPMAQIIDEINIHCPGCVTPGMIVDELTVKRTNFGYLDANENGLIDLGVSSPMTLSQIESVIPINASKTMPGDQVELLAHAFFQDGDGGNGGFSYSTYESLFGPGALDRLYIDVRIPCGHENNNMWNLVSAEISTEGGAYMDITSFIVNNPNGINDGQYFFEIKSANLGGDYYVNQTFDVRLVYDICKNNTNDAEVIDCDVTCIMWLAGGNVMDRDAFSTELFAPVENELNYTNMPGSTDLELASFIHPHSIFNCENFGSQVKHYRFYTTENSRWSNKGVDDYWNQYDCRKKLLSLYKIKLGISNNAQDFFKFEHRPISGRFLSYNFPIPNYYDLVTSDYVIQTTVPIHNGSTTILPILEDITSQPPVAISSSNGVFSYNPLNYQLASESNGLLTSLTQGGNFLSQNLFLGDEFWSQEIEVYFDPEATCDPIANLVPVATSSVQYQASYVLSASTNCNLGTSFSHATTAADSGDENLFKPVPNLVISQPVAQYVESANHCFVFSLSNAGGMSLSENTYFIIQPPSGVLINSVKQNGNIIIPVNGVYQIGTFATFGWNQSSNFEICLSIDHCTSNQLILPIRYGNGCNGYPANAQDQGCWENVMNVILNPAQSALNASNINTLQDLSISPCGDAYFKICTDPSDNGDLANLNWSISLPPNSFLTSDVVVTYYPVGQAPQSVTLPQASIISGQLNYADPLWTLIDLNDQICIEFNYGFIAGCPTNLGEPPIIQIGGVSYCGQAVNVIPNVNPLAMGISQCTPITAPAVITSVMCTSSGAIDITPTGTGPLSFSWLDPNGNSLTTEDISGILAPGMYSLTITDGLNCSQSFNFNVPYQNDLVTLNITACDSYTLNGVNYTNSGTYYYTQANSVTGCPEDVTLNLIIYNTPFINTPASITACASYTLQPITGSNLSGSQQYYDNSQANGGQFITGPITSTQTVWIYDSNGSCSAEESFTVIIMNTPFIHPTFSQVADICAGDQLLPLPTTSNNGIVGSWSPALDNTATTTYTFSPNPGQCAFNEYMTINVTQNVLPTFIQIPPICAGDPLGPLPGTSLNMISGYWLPAIDNMTTTTYTFYPYDDGPCALTTTMMIIVNPVIQPTFILDTDLCSGDIVNPLQNTSIEYVIGTWSPQILSNTTSGIYTFTPTLGQCAVTSTYFVTVNPLPTISVVHLGSGCQGVQEALVPSGANTYTISPNETWTGSNFNILVSSSSTIYTITGTDINGCQNSATYTINPQPLITLDPAISQTCPGEAVVLTPSNGAISYMLYPPIGLSQPGSPGTLISGSPFIVNPLATTTYTITPMDDIECPNIATAVVNVNTGSVSNLQAVNVQASFVSISWTATSVANPSLYTISYQLVGASNWTTFSTISASSGIVNATITGFIPGSNYVIQVADDCTSEIVYVTTFKVDCDGPINAVVIEALATSVNIGWNPVPNCLGYDYAYRLANSAVWISAGTGSPSSSSNIFTNLSPNSTYQFRIRRYCFGSPQVVTTQILTLTTLSPCANPIINLSLGAVLGSQATINWNNIPGVAWFESRYNVVGGPPIGLNGTTNNTAAPSRTITGLLPNTNYEFHVRAKCSSTIASGWTTIIISTSSLVGCELPPVFTISQTSQTSVTLNWNPISPVGWFEFRHKLSSSNNWPIGPYSTANASATSKLIVGLLPNTSYDFQMHAICPGGNQIQGPWSSPVTQQTNLLPPGLPVKSAELSMSEKVSGHVFDALLFPNPSQGHVYLTLTGNETNLVLVRVYDLSGKEVYNKHLEVTEGNSELNLDSAPGSYFVTILDEKSGNQVIRKLIIDQN